MADGVSVDYQMVGFDVRYLPGERRDSLFLKYPSVEDTPI